MEQDYINKKSKNDIDILREMLVLLKLIDKYHNKISKKFNITQVQLEVLYSLYISGDMELKMSILGEKLEISKSGISTLIDKMAIEGLVKKRPDLNDKRIMKVVMAKKGSEVIKNIFPSNEVFKVSVLDFLQEEEKELLNKLIIKANEKLEEKCCKI